MKAAMHGAALKNLVPLTILILFSMSGESPAVALRIKHHFLGLSFPLMCHELDKATVRAALVKEHIICSQQLPLQQADLDLLPFTPWLTFSQSLKQRKINEALSNNFELCSGQRTEKAH